MWQESINNHIFSTGSASVSSPAMINANDSSMAKNDALSQSQLANSPSGALSSSLSLTSSSDTSVLSNSNTLLSSSGNALLEKSGGGSPFSLLSHFHALPYQDFSRRYTRLCIELIPSVW